MRNTIIEEDLHSIYSQQINWERFQNKTVLISGAYGFLPAYMVETLLYLNEQIPDFNVKVVALVRNPEKAKIRFVHYENREDLSFLIQSVDQPVNYEGPIDFIIHAASPVNTNYTDQDPVGTIKANTTGTMNLLELAIEKNVEAFLFFSSSATYGTIDLSRNPIREDFLGTTNQLALRSCYAESKRMGENICIAYHHQFGVPCKIIRPYFVYGPGVDLKDNRAWVEFTSDIINNQSISLQTDGSAIRDFIYLTDAVVAFFMVLLAGNICEPYNIGSGQGTSIWDLVNILVNLFLEKGLTASRVDPGEIPEKMKSTLNIQIADTTKLSTLGWNGVVSVEEGFRRMILSYSEPFGTPQ